jgi:imidazolonepropionase-like amidohydrolase
MKKRVLLLACVFVIVGAMLSAAHDYVPGQPQTQPVLLKGGDLYTVADGVLSATDLLFENGRITRIAPDLTPPDNALVIDVTGQRVYPGLIDAFTGLGLIEIGEVRATNDLDEVGSITPEVAAHTAYNTDSEVLPTVRAEGITTALVVPGGSLICGRSSLMNLDGWTKEDAAEKPIVALHIVWPRQRVLDVWWMTKTPKQQKEANRKRREELTDAFEKAQAYRTARLADPSTPLDTRWEAMMPVFDQSIPVVVHADSRRQIEQAAAFGERFSLRLILAEGHEAYRALDILRDYDIPVIVRPLHSMPMREDDDYDITFKLPALLRDSGITFCIASYGKTSSRNLSLQAGQSVAFGLSRENALRAITLSPAELLGVADDLGSLEVGKKATLFVSDGDVLNFGGHHVMRMFIEGRAVDLNSRHKELYEKYRQRPAPADIAQ